MPENHPAPTPHPSDTLVGREDDLAAITGLIRAVSHTGGALLMLGEAGIGKTSLLRAGAAFARTDGCEVLEATGVETETRLPFAGLHQLLRPILQHADTLPTSHRAALHAALGLATGPAPEPFLISLATLNLLSEAAAERPIVLIVDDAQWLDTPSHDTIAFIARRLERDPIALIAAVRSGHDGPIRAAGLPELTVTGLDDTAARTLLGRHAADLDAADRHRIVTESLGNPLALVELPAAWRTSRQSGAQPGLIPLTARLERAFASRLGELGPTCREALLIAAVDDDDELAEILAATTVLAGTTVGVDTLEVAARLGLVSFDGLRMRFRHPLVRSGILQVESLARRNAAHAALAQVLAGQPYRRTWHRAQAIVGIDDDVADELETNHTIALRRGSVQAAIWALERSAQLTSDSARRGRRLLLAAGQAFGLGRADMVDRLLALAERNTLSELDLARMEWLREIFNDGVPGDATRVLELCDIAERSAKADDTDLALNLLLGAALRCWWADTGPAARARVVTVTEHLDGVERDPRYVATLAVAEPIARAHVVDSLLGAVILEKVTDPDALRLYGMAAHAVGDPVRAVDFLGRAEARLREQGRLGLLGHVLTMQILDRLEVGDWPRAVSCFEEGQRVARDTGQPIWDTGTMSLGAMLTAIRGDNTTAQKLAADAEHGATGRGLNDLLACVHLARGYGWITTGHYTEAYDALAPIFDPGTDCYHPTERFHGIAYLAEAAVRCGRADDARTILKGLERDTVLTPSPTLRIHLAYARAALADDDHAEDLYTRALDDDLIRWPWPRARLELAYGTWLRRQRRVAESRLPLRSAQTTFELIGAHTWAEQAQAELRAAGERTAETQTNPGDVLSAQELQIAHLAAEGLSNREIGARLFLSPRTIGSHLYRIFPKLDITSRNQLPARLQPR
jgi:DNA-binding CsgD family transcriptional regulator